MFMSGKSFAGKGIRMKGCKKSSLRFDNFLDAAADLRFVRLDGLG
jgi:hypothetical protein